MYLAYFIGMLSTGVCTPRHQQTSGRLVQELNVCTVAIRLHVPIYCVSVMNLREFRVIFFNIREGTSICMILYCA